MCANRLRYMVSDRQRHFWTQDCKFRHKVLRDANHTIHCWLKASKKCVFNPPVNQKVCLQTRPLQLRQTVLPWEVQQYANTKRCRFQAIKGNKKFLCTESTLGSIRTNETCKAASAPGKHILKHGKMKWRRLYVQSNCKQLAQLWGGEAMTYVWWLARETDKQKCSRLKHLRLQKIPPTVLVKQTCAGILQLLYAINSPARAVPCPHHRKEQPDWGRRELPRCQNLLLMSIAHEDKS